MASSEADIESTLRQFILYMEIRTVGQNMTIQFCELTCNKYIIYAYKYLNLSQLEVKLCVSSSQLLYLLFQTVIFMSCGY